MDRWMAGIVTLGSIKCLLCTRSYFLSLTFCFSSTAAQIPTLHAARTKEISDLKVDGRSEKFDNLKSITLK